MLRLLAVLLVALGLDAKACMVPPDLDVSLDANTEYADEVFVARVLAADEVQNAEMTQIGRANVRIRYSIIETLKGSPADVGHVYSNYTTCSVWLVPTVEFLLFVSRDRKSGTRVVLGHYRGSSMYVPGGRVDATLEEIRRSILPKTSTMSTP